MGYRLMTLSGVNGPDAGFALATAGLGSAVVLNLIFWLALMVSIPIRGVNPGYATAAIAGIVLMLIAGGIVFGLMEGRVAPSRSCAGSPASSGSTRIAPQPGVRHIGLRLEDLAGDRKLLVRVLGWAAANWMLDAAALWVFLRAFGSSHRLRRPDRRLRSRQRARRHPASRRAASASSTSACRSRSSASECRRSTAVLGVATYRLAQFFFPIVLGGVLYAQLARRAVEHQAPRPSCAPARHRRRDAIERRACARLLRSVLPTAATGRTATRRSPLEIAGDRPIRRRPSR